MRNVDEAIAVVEEAIPGPRIEYCEVDGKMITMGFTTTNEVFHVKWKLDDSGGSTSPL